MHYEGLFMADADQGFPGSRLSGLRQLLAFVTAAHDPEETSGLAHRTTVDAEKRPIQNPISNFSPILSRCISFSRRLLFIT